MVRILSLLVILSLSACSRTPASAHAEGAGGAAQSPGGNASAQPAKPVPDPLPDVLARVNGETVTKAEFDRALSGMESQNGSVPGEQRDRVYRELLDQLIGYKLLLQESKARNVAIPDAEIESQMSQLRGRFPSEEVFANALREQNVTIEQLRDDARNQLAIAKMVQDEIAAKVAVKPEQVETFYKENPDRFQQGERVKASHILIGVPQNADATAKAQAKTKADQVLADAKAGKDFAALAREHSQDPGSAVNGGDLGFFQRGQMVGPFDAVAFSLAPGAISDVVETQFGFHVIKVAEKEAGRTVPLDEVRPRVEQYLEGVNRQQETAAFVNALRQKGKVEVLI